MVTTRLVAGWLLFVGIVWLLTAAWMMLVMSGISTPAVAVSLLLTMYFAGPIALIVGSSLVIARRRGRIGTVLASLACAWLTWMIASDYWPRTPANDAIAPVQYDSLFIALALIVIVSDVAVIAMWRAPQPSNQAMQRTAPRSDA
jgi:hypothetical protein